MPPLFNYLRLPSFFFFYNLINSLFLSFSAIPSSNFVPKFSYSILIFFQMLLSIARQLRMPMAVRFVLKKNVAEFYIPPRFVFGDKNFGISISPCVIYISLQI